jgi:phytoene desaturase
MSDAEDYTGTRACVIGSGFGGLALAIRLQSAGIATTLVEARDKPGGRAYFWEQEGFTFDAGPTVITDPACLRELWALSGNEMRHSSGAHELCDPRRRATEVARSRQRR